MWRGGELSCGGELPVDVAESCRGTESCPWAWRRVVVRRKVAVLRRGQVSAKRKVSAVWTRDLHDHEAGAASWWVLSLGGQTPLGRAVPARRPWGLAFPGVGAFPGPVVPRARRPP